MSVFIKGMDMPKNCELCSFCDAVGVCKFIGDVNENIRNGTKDLRCPIIEAPTHAEPKKGRWINDIRYSWWTCSECNYHDGNKTDKFCPNCGADMRAEPKIIRCKDCRWGREACGNIECFADTNVPPEYHGYEWFCPNAERRTDE